MFVYTNYSILFPTYFEDRSIFWTNRSNHHREDNHLLCIPTPHMIWQRSMGCISFYEHYNFLHTSYIFVYCKSGSPTQTIPSNFWSRFDVSRKLNAAIPAMRTRFLFWNVNIHRHRHRHTCMRDRAMGRHHFGFYVCVCVKNQKPSTMCQNSAPKISVYRFCCVCINIHKCV